MSVSAEFRATKISNEPGPVQPSRIGNGSVWMIEIIIRFLVFHWSTHGFLTASYKRQASEFWAISIPKYLRGMIKQMWATLQESMGLYDRSISLLFIISSKSILEDLVRIGSSQANKLALCV